MVIFCQKSPLFAICYLLNLKNVSREKLPTILSKNARKKCCNFIKNAYIVNVVIIF